MQAIHLTEQEFKNKVGDYTKLGDKWKYIGDKPAIIDFYASWCGPCRALTPILDEIATEHINSIYVYKVDVDREKELALAFGIRSIPTIFFMPMQGNPRRIKGALSKSIFEAKISELLMAETV
ncbi:MAG: thioredoxin domain-containing protein [Rikenellaceae bacterium]